MHIIRKQGIYSRTVKLSSQLHRWLCLYRILIGVESSRYHTLTMICQEMYRVNSLLAWLLDTIRYDRQHSCKHGLNVIISVDVQSLWWNSVRSGPMYSSLPFCHSIIDQTVSASSSVSDASLVIRPAKCDTSRLL